MKPFLTVAGFLRPLRDEFRSKSYSLWNCLGWISIFIGSYAIGKWLKFMLWLAKTGTLEIGMRLSAKSQRRGGHLSLGSPISSPNTFYCSLISLVGQTRQVFKRKLSMEEGIERLGWLRRPERGILGTIFWEKNAGRGNSILLIRRNFCT